MRVPSGPPEKAILWRIGLFLLPSFLRLLFRMRFVGLERLPAGGPTVLAANHLSVFDPFMLAMATHRRGRVPQFLAAAEFYTRPILGPLVRGIRQIPVHRGINDRNALDEAVRQLRRGSLVGIFPEGHVGAPPKVRRGKTGVARIALVTGAPVVPMAIWGTHKRWPLGGLRLSRPLRRHRAIVVMGEPLYPQGDPTSPAAARAFTDRIMERIAELVEEARAMDPETPAP
ncbi:MAG: 1-acyl-sn-glycerol-3-phosphate acyltransferase [Actinomycetota bacterium]|nr:1-acyl-sn-glycerol-3-phosphate acyltransferase [Actinomycetota bacterium]